MSVNPEVLTLYTSPYPKMRLGGTQEEQLISAEGVALSRSDGGYVISNIPNVEYSLLLSGGIGDDISFEEAFCNLYSNVKCVAFDGTIENITINNDNVSFIKKNISPNNDETSNPPTTNLKNFIDLHDNIFLKMDIEHHEHPWIQSLSENQMNKFSQIVIEIHGWYNMINTFEKLNKNHYLIHFHGNTNQGIKLQQGILIPKIFEATYLHKKYFINPPELNKDILPTKLDRMNCIGDKEFFIDYPPFVHNLNNSPNKLSNSQKINFGIKPLVYFTLDKKIASHSTNDYFGNEILNNYKIGDIIILNKNNKDLKLNIINKTIINKKIILIFNDNINKDFYEDRRDWTIVL